MKSRADISQVLGALLNAVETPEGAQAEISYAQRESRTTSWADGLPQLQETSLTEGVCLRVLREGGQGMITTRTLALDHVKALGRDALAMARVAPVDPHRKFARPASSYPPEPAVDEHLFTSSTDAVLADLAGLEKRVLTLDPRIRKVVKFAMSESRSISGLANTNGVTLIDTSSQVSFVAEVLAEDSGQTEVAWDFQSRRFGDGFAIDPIAEAVAVHAAQSLGGRPLPSGKYNVVVHPRVGAQLLDLLSNALSAEAVQRGRSFWAGLLTQPVASPSVTLIDDPLLPDGVASGSFDSEGTPHRTCLMVSDGILHDYFYDLRSASKEEKESNGHGLKAGLAAVPGPAPTNFYMKRGIAHVHDILGSEKSVFHLRDVMGLHMADPITGEFSLGASGFLVENGVSVRPVRGVTIAGSLPTIMKSISSVADDLTWYGSIGCPSFLLPNVTIAGS